LPPHKQIESREKIGGIFLVVGLVALIPSVMVPVATGDRRNVRWIQAACGEQLHHEEEDLEKWEKNRGRR
jgi:hypothetical protein